MREAFRESIPMAQSPPEDIEIAGAALVQQRGAIPKVPINGEFVVKFVDESSDVAEELSEEALALQRLNSLLPEHLHPELLIEKIDEKMTIVAANSWFKEGIATGNEPNMQYALVNQTTQEMLDFLADRGVITEEMALEGRINLAGSTYVKIANERLKTKQPDETTRGLVRGANEGSAIEIIKLKARLLTEEKRKEI